MGPGYDPKNCNPFSWGPNEICWKRTQLSVCPFRLSGTIQMTVFFFILSAQFIHCIHSLSPGDINDGKLSHLSWILLTLNYLVLMRSECWKDLNCLSESSSICTGQTTVSFILTGLFNSIHPTHSISFFLSLVFNQKQKIPKKIQKTDT